MKGDLTPGKRIYAGEDGILRLRPTEYGLDRDGAWKARCPDPSIGMGDLTLHEVTEHEDGTITVHPSILIETGEEENTPRWHGYLEKGVWRED